jgi:hypothetical protein
VTAEPQQPAPPAPEWQGDPGERVYANVMKIAGGPFDVLLTFGIQKHPDQPGQVPVVTEVAEVSMSWAHLKSMIPVMAKVVADYESRFGPVPAPGFGENWKA